MSIKKELPKRATHYLSAGRNSQPYARYFVTCCSALNSLHQAPFASLLKDVFLRMQDNGDFRMLCSTIMPDHIHILMELGSRLSIGQTLGKLKFLARTIRWQRDFYDHRLRPDEVANPYARYIFMNPYRRQLVGAHEQWPHWTCQSDNQFDFQAMLNDGKPPEDWFSEPSEIGLPDGHEA